MNPFSYCNSTRLIYGRGVSAQIGAVAQGFAQEHKRVLVVYGGASAKRTGLLDRVCASLAECGLGTVLAGGVRPNPTVELVREIIDLIRREPVDAIVAVGGGSVIDTAKGVALGAGYEGDVWDFYCGKAQPRRGIPVIALLTIPAAGSEQSMRSVINNGEIKAGAGNEALRPVAAVVDPELFVTLPRNQVAAGVCDMMSHIFERYFTNTQGVDYTTEQAEAALRVILRHGRTLSVCPTDVPAWEQVGLAGSFAHCGYFGMGHQEDWACHGIEHALSGWDPAITHGAGLAVIIPAWMRYVWRVNPERFERFALQVMQVKPGADQQETILSGIKALQDYFQAFGLPVRLQELSQQPVPLERIAQLATLKPLGFFKRLEKQDVLEILKLAQ